MDALRVTEGASAAVQKTQNRVSLDDMESKIAAVEFYNPTNIPHMTVAIVVMKNGHAVLGKSIPIDAMSFDAEIGRRLARDDAIRKLSTLEAYAARKWSQAPVEAVSDD